MRKIGAPVPARRRSSGGAGASASVAGPYASDDLGLSMYSSAPDVEVSVREFEDIARDRLRVLHVFDRVCSYDSKLDNMSEFKPKLMKDLVDSQLVMNYPATEADMDAFDTRKAEFVKRDSVSHFVLRFAFCKTRDARDWFLRQEQRLWVLRFESLRPEAQEEFIKRSNLKCRKFDMTSGIPDGQGKVNLHEIQHATPAAKIYRGDGVKPEWDSTFYLMPFYEVDPRLIASRRVVIVNGNAYVPSITLKLILAKRFRDALAASLDVAFIGLPRVLADPRIGGFLRDLQDYGLQLLVAKAASSEDVGEQLTLENFEELMLRSFPPCMRRVVERQRETKKHLKHAGRLQLRPFLKECGFAIDDSMKWWKQELCKDQTVDAVSFEKNYTYDVEHTYGKKGHLQGQNSFGCPKIISFPAESAGQCHGCPFKNLDVPGLRQQMHKWKVPERTVLEMEKLINNGKHFQLACIEYFKALHVGHEGDGVGNSPGDFFRESCRHYAKKKEQAGGATTSPSKPGAAVAAVTPSPTPAGVVAGSQRAP